MARSWPASENPDNEIESSYWLNLETGELEIFDGVDHGGVGGALAKLERVTPEARRGRVRYLE